MDNSNIIISVIIVLCIAAGVTAYGISEGDNAVFNDLTGFSPDTSDSGSNGIGDLIGNNSNDGTGSDISSGSSSNPSSVSNNGGSSSNSGSNGGSSSNGGSNSGSGTGTGTGTGTGNGTGTGTGTGSGNSSQGQTVQKISSSQAKSIASGFIGEEGAYVSSVTDDGTQYICYISNSTGDVVDAIAISYSGENLGRA